jgi:predicted O-methyltransferase YrrM
MISPEDHETLIAWHEQTRAEWPNAGASGVEMMTMLTGLILSSGLTRIVQCGHYVGFSTLLLGMIGRQMGVSKFLYSVDIAEVPSAYTRRWLEKAGLTNVEVAVHDSADPVCVQEAAQFLGGPPQLVYVDSSHQYEHTRRELVQWWAALPPGGLLVMDDVSAWAAAFDSTKKGGSHRAAAEFRQHHAPNGAILNGTLHQGAQSSLIYTDVCGFGLFQKPYAFG